MSNSTDVLINFVLDRSGSMGSIAQATVEGVNGFLDGQREIEGQSLLSLTLFDTQFDVRYVATPLSDVPPMTLGSGRNAYSIGGGTALYDAVGTTIKGTEAWLVNHPDFTGKVVVVILTDGQENSSRDWHIHANARPEDDRDINNLIRYKQGEGWEFLFLGSGQSAWLESQKFTSLVTAGAVYDYAGDAASTGLTYSGVSRSLRASRVKGSNFNAAAVASAIADEDAQ